MLSIDWQLNFFEARIFTNLTESFPFCQMNFEFRFLPLYNVSYTYIHICNILLLIIAILIG
jgi:hypothetical protein